MPVHNPKIRLLHMLDYAQKAVAMVNDESRASLDNDEKLHFALTRLVELIGEAASHVPPEIQKKYPQIPWPQIINMRHRLIHGYDAVDNDILWDTITLSLPELIKKLSDIIQNQPHHQ
ncbi:MAG: DUF86 domain-containing protein [Desulfosalsimonas sp.]